MDSKIVQGKSGKLAVIIELPSKDSAIDAYNRVDYQEISKLRWATLNGYKYHNY